MKVMRRNSELILPRIVTRTAPAMIIVVLGLLSGPEPLWAAPDSGGGSPDVVLSSFKALGALLLVLALILIAAWAARRYFHFLPRPGTKGDGIQVLAGKSLTPKSSVHLLEVEGRKMLVGSSEGGVSLLKDFSKGDT